jgi:hypothetical protein
MIETLTENILDCNYIPRLAAAQSLIAFLLSAFLLQFAHIVIESQQDSSNLLAGILTPSNTIRFLDSHIFHAISGQTFRQCHDAKQQKYFISLIRYKFLS